MPATDIKCYLFNKSKTRFYPTTPQPLPQLTNVALIKGIYYPHSFVSSITLNAILFTTEESFYPNFYPSLNMVKMTDFDTFTNFLIDNGTKVNCVHCWSIKTLMCEILMK